MIQSEIARHKATQQGNNRFSFFDVESEKKIAAFHEHLKTLRTAIKENQLELYYQPQINADNGNVIGIEALLRWAHPDKGLLVPDQFLRGLDSQPIALELGDWVLNRALKQIDKLVQNHINIPISINIASYQLEDKYFISRLEETLSKYPQLPYFCLKLEILETEALEDIEHISKIIKECRDMGLLFSLDDFGTGYSSLTYLKNLPTAEVKLDQSFTRNILSDPNDLSILMTTIGLCRLIDRDLIAEGVETIVHGKLLVHLGCKFLQGYALAKPMPEKQLITWLKKWKLDKKWQESRFSKEEVDSLILLATQHHLSFKSLRRSIEYNGDNLENLSFDNCQITHWLEKFRDRLKDYKTYNTIYKLHKKQHAMANRVIQLQIKGQTEEALTQLNKLDELLSTLLKKFITSIFEP